MRVLVTGCDGYIGQVLVPLLQRAGHEVTGLDSGLFAGCVFPGQPRPELPVIWQDVRDVMPETLVGFDAVLHLGNAPMRVVNVFDGRGFSNRASGRSAGPPDQAVAFADGLKAMQPLFERAGPKVWFSKAVKLFADGAMFSQLMQMQAHGAKLLRIPGFVTSPDVTQTVFDQLTAFTANGPAALVVSAFRYCPIGMNGVKSVAREIVQQLPSVAHVFVPAGSGGLFAATQRAPAANATSTIAANRTDHATHSSAYTGLAAINRDSTHRQNHSIFHLGHTLCIAALDDIRTAGRAGSQYQRSCKD